MSLISIIIPIYNIESYLARCFDSIIDQTYQNFEVIAVDDGSQDGSFVVCNEYAQKDDRFIPLHQENGGASKARNAGIQIARGEYLAFVDGDDYLNRNYLNELLDAITRSRASISMCGLKCVDNNGREIVSHFSRNEVPQNVTGREAVCCIGKNVVFGVVWNKLYRRELFNDIRFTVGRTFEDELILHHIYGKVDKIACVQDELYYYVQREGSKMKESYTASKMDIIFAYLDRIKFLNENNYPSTQITWTNERLLEFFRIAALHGLKTKEGRRKFSILHKEYGDTIDQLSSNLEIKCSFLFRFFPINYCFGLTLFLRMKKVFDVGNK